jgi:hypothetical protein
VSLWQWKKQIDNHKLKAAKWMMRQRVHKRAASTDNAYSATPVFAKSTSSGTLPKRRADNPHWYRPNPLRERGHGKIWAEDAKANIGFIQGKLDIIKARECMRELEPSRKDHTVNLATPTPVEILTKKS